MDQNQTEVEEYINHFSVDIKNRLTSLRKLVHSLSPEAEEGIMYGLIGYKLDKKPLVYFGAFANHIGVYATPNTHHDFKDKLTNYKQGKGSVQFPNNQSLPSDLISDMIIHRIKSIQQNKNISNQSSNELSI